MRLDNERLKQSGFLVVLMALGIILLWFLFIFLNAFLGSIIFYILLRRPYFYLTQKAKWKWNRNLATIFLMLVSFVVLVMPVLSVSWMLSGKIGYLIVHYGELLRMAAAWSRQAQDFFGVDLMSSGTITRLSSWATQILPGFLSATIGVVADIFVLYFILYFMLVNAGNFEKLVLNNMPFKDENDHILLTELKRQTISNAIGIPILAILQAITAWIAYWILGMPEPFFWAVITGLMSMLPVVGTTIVWLPIAIFLYASGMHWQGITLFIYGLIVITNIDNVFRFVVQKKLGDVHPLVTFFGVILGLQLFGFVGIIFGPLLISYFILLLKIYRKAYLE